ncbi:MAG: diphosphomevalonate decarboxylase [Bacteroidota bacterium]
MKLSSCTAVAGTNIALVKYWGKRDVALNLPATGSLSLTLKEMGTRTTVRFGGQLVNEDRVRLNGREPDPQTCARVGAFLDLVRERAGIKARAEVITENSVPTAAGLASSASGFAALAMAASRAAGLALLPAQLSALARRGSGSAARSIFGGFVEMRAGVLADGTDAVAVSIPEGDGWPVRLVVAETAEGEKAIGSTAAMERTTRTSPYYEAWIDSVPRDIQEARAALNEHDLPRLGAIAERSALRMHACAMAADPPIVYWTPATLAAMDAVRALRRRGVEAYFTVDAGPHVKVLCHLDTVAEVQAAMAASPGVRATLVASPGRGARILHETTA